MGTDERSGPRPWMGTDERSGPSGKVIDNTAKPGRLWGGQHG